MKNKVREASPELADWLNLIKQHFSITAIAVKVGDDVIYRQGHFEPTKQEVKDCATFRAKQPQSDSERL